MGIAVFQSAYFFPISKTGIKYIGSLCNKKTYGGYSEKTKMSLFASVKAISSSMYGTIGLLLLFSPRANKTAEDNLNEESRTGGKG